MRPAWLLAAVLVVGGARAAVGQCWEQPSCQEPNSESTMMDCIQLCRSDLTAETPVVPGNAHVHAPPPSDPSWSWSWSSSWSPSPEAKRSYSMEHFRWGKAAGRKRRPVKVYTSNAAEDAGTFPGDMRRRAEEEQEVMEEEEAPGNKRYGGAPGNKRYGGFMKSQRPLLALFRNVINKDGRRRD